MFEHPLTSHSKASRVGLEEGSGESWRGDAAYFREFSNSCTFSMPRVFLDAIVFAPFGVNHWNRTSLRFFEPAPKVGFLSIGVSIVTRVKRHKRLAQKLSKIAHWVLQTPERQLVLVATIPDDTETGFYNLHPLAKVSWSLCSRSSQREHCARRGRQNPMYLHRRGVESYIMFW